ncbi:MAG: HAD hydrolase family protein [Eggerthellaceae bacterium]|nr:HAD hydrolase family protein [Eggerthellaceae bacterium]
MIELALTYRSLITGNVIAVWDSNNYLGIMDLRKYWVAMSNAIDKCKKVTTFATGNIDDGGIIMPVGIKVN